mmetsp:Transcript_4388/g.6920  ORF Transcript_4388/g.6920 Transcript_4388/m.6920 type:complete len:209 (-) Transcript_4388:113-739(-)
MHSANATEVYNPWSKNDQMKIKNAKALDEELLREFESAVTLLENDSESEKKQNRGHQIHPSKSLEIQTKLSTTILKWLKLISPKTLLYHLAFNENPTTSMLDMLSTTLCKKKNYDYDPENPSQGSVPYRCSMNTYDMVYYALTNLHHTIIHHTQPDLNFQGNSNLMTQKAVFFLKIAIDALKSNWWTNPKTSHVERPKRSASKSRQQQ